MNATAIPEDELAAIAAALLVMPSVESEATVVEGPPNTWLATARREAIGLE
ncbi:MAG: hypothetical protein M3R30_04505 [Candidatus Eremiobacteraeota bacterium]|nr:hypothetical protein [Candidatus Eremiobacteraeota bacterium]